MHIDLTLCLPRDGATLPTVRHLCKFALTEIGVIESLIADVELAVTEACANVIEHTTVEDVYEVRIGISPQACEIRVIDTGRGFDFEDYGLRDADADDEGGRGIQLMRSLVDRIGFSSAPEKGTMVHLVKALDLDPEKTPAFLTPD